MHPHTPYSRGSQQAHIQPRKPFLVDPLTTFKYIETRMEIVIIWNMDKYLWICFGSLRPAGYVSSNRLWPFKACYAELSWKPLPYSLRFQVGMWHRCNFFSDELYPNVCVNLIPQTSIFTSAQKWITSAPTMVVRSHWWHCQFEI